MDKALLRRESFRRLKALEASDRERRSRILCDRISELPAFRQAATVHTFLALPSEPEIGALCLRFPEKDWAVPRVEAAGERLRFHLLPQPGDLVRGEHGILEPADDAPPAPPFVDLVLVPGVAFDPESGARLGRGKGHYDRFLGRLTTGADRPFLVGVCFQEQLVPLVPEAHDVPMDLVVSA